MPFFAKKPPMEYIAVFLGNPGARYDNTRHNVGFMVGDTFAQNAGAKINKIKFSSLTGTAVCGGARIFLMKPQTYMNLSGGALWQAMHFYKVPLERVIAVSDDVSLPVGKLRVRAKGSAGGHNGLRDIIAKCGGEDFARIKIGVGPPPEGYELADWVLSKLTGADEKAIKDAVKDAATVLETIITQGVDQAMRDYN